MQPFRNKYQKQTLRILTTNFLRTKTMSVLSRSFFKESALKFGRYSQIRCNIRFAAKEIGTTADIFIKEYCKMFKYSKVVINQLIKSVTAPNYEVLEFGLLNTKKTHFEH